MSRKSAVRLAALLLASAAAAASAQIPPAALAAQGADEIIYTMPAGWVAQAVQAGPEIKAHYAYYSGGMPYGEMYLSQTPLTGPSNLDQVFEEGLSKLRPNLPYYQARATQKVNLGGLTAIVHEFVYMPTGSGTLFSARTYTLIAGATVSTFFFQTVSNHYANMQNVFAQVMATVRAAPRPAWKTTPLPPAPAPAPAPLPATTTQTGGLTAEDMGLSYNLPSGWTLADDTVGAKYRLYDGGGAQIASLFILKPDPMAGFLALSGGSISQVLDSALRTQVDGELRTYAKYAPAGTRKRLIGGFEGIVHDCDFEINGRPVFYRYALFAVPQKGERPSVVVAPKVMPFAFLGTDPGRKAEVLAAWDAILDSMRPQGAPAPAPAAEKLPAIAPPAKEEGVLPKLDQLEPEEGLHPDPFGRYKVKLPAAAKHMRTSENAATFMMPAAGTTFIVHSYKSEETGARLAGRFAEGKRLNGAPTTLTCGGHTAEVSLYTARNDRGENTAWVVSLYPGSGLLIVVTLPARSYESAQGWIMELIRGVRW